MHEWLKHVKTSIRAGELRARATTEFEVYDPVEEMTENIFQTALDERRKWTERRDKILRKYIHIRFLTFVAVQFRDATRRHRKWT